MKEQSISEMSVLTRHRDFLVKQVLTHISDQPHGLHEELGEPLCRVLTCSSPHCNEALRYSLGNLTPPIKPARAGRRCP